MPVPLTAVVLKLLLDHGSMYGLELVKRSNGLLKRGSVYVILDRMEEQKLISSKVTSTPDGQQGPARRSYTITGTGRRTYESIIREQIERSKFLGLEGS